MKFKARVENIAVQTAGSETMVYDLTTHRAYLLNETSSFVWNLCNGENDITDIARELEKKTAQPASLDIVKLAIDALKAIDLLSESENTEDFFTRSGRRKALRQIGLATMIALPVIGALVAPTPAMAQSACLILNQACTFANGMQSNCCANLRCNSTCQNCFTSFSNVVATSSVALFTNLCCSGATTQPTTPAGDGTPRVILTCNNPIP